MKDSIIQSLEIVDNRIIEAAKKSGRDKSGIKLIAASKTVPPDILRLAHEVGILRFGENRVQELKAKAPLMPPSTEWHFIGGLQTNKVRDVVRIAKLIHSVDRSELIQEIESKAGQMAKTQQILIEVNVGGESSKHGAAPEQAQQLAEEANNCQHLEVVGFMTVAPFYEDLEKVRPFFAQLRELRDSIEKNTGFILPELSMGMSHDYTVAVEEGATMVRIGSALFGDRKSRGK